MGRHQETARIGRQRDVQQITRIQTENRPAVRCQVADLGQRRGDPVGGIEARRVNKVVHLPGALSAPVNGGYLDGKHEPDRAGADGRGIAEEPFFKLRPDPEQAGLGRDEGFPQFRRPRGVGEISGSEHGETLAQRPRRKVLDIAVLAAGARESRMNMQVSVEHVGGATPWRGSGRV